MSKLRDLASGVRWGAVSISAVTLFQLVFMAVMARLLDPADFGLVAIANVVLRFFSYFAQMGIGPALIQKKTLTDGDIRAALSLSLGVSSLFFLLAVATAGFIERFFEMESLAMVMRVLAINFVVFGFSSVSLGLIRRNRAFKALAITEIVSYVVGYGIVGLGAAYQGAGVWALVAAFLSQTLISAVMGYSFARHTVGFRHAQHERRHFIGYGGRYSLIGFIEFLTSNIDSLIVGKLMGATTAGYYNRSLLLANLPVQQPTKVITQALFPVMSSMSDQHEKQSISVQLSALIVGCYAFAVGLGISVAAPDIVTVLLGAKWLETIPVLQILALSVGPIYMSNVMGVTLDSMGKLSTKLRIQIIVFALLGGLLLIAAPSGDVRLVAMAVVATFWARLCIISWVVVRALAIPVVNGLKIVLCVVIVSLVAGGMILIASHIIASGLPVVARLSIEILTGLAGLVVGMWLSRYILNQHPAVIYLADRMPGVSRFVRL